MTVYWNGQQQVQEVSGGIRVLRAEPAPAALRPRATRRRVDKVVIRWPSGVTSELPHPQLDQVHRVKEPV